MKFSAAAATLATLIGAASAGSKSSDRTFAVLRFNGEQLVRTRVDPIVSPGQPATHVHGVMGGSNFGLSATGDTLAQSKCSNAMIAGDNSAYWFPWLYFQDPKTKKFEPVELFYVNVYYFFEGTDDEIKAFPKGLQIVSGNASTRVVPSSGGKQNLEPADGPVQPVQWTCPRSNYNPASYPANSDGSTAGIVDPNNSGAGVGFPDQNCDGYGSPLRADVHMPSCYDPSKALDDYENSMSWPTNKDSTDKRRANCPPGHIHVPHMFFEVYWNTPKFSDRWTPGQGTQPFVLSNGDVSGYSSHGDFIAAWDTDVLQQIIDNCNAGSSGMDKCPGLLKGLNTNQDCTIPSPIDEKTDGILDNLPGSNPLGGWSFGNIIGGSGLGNILKPSSGGASASASGSAKATPVKSASAQPAATSGAVQKEDVAPVQQAPEQPAASQAVPSKAAQPSSPAAVVTNPLGNDNGSNPKTSCLRKTRTVYQTVTVTGTLSEATQATPAAAPANNDNYKARRHVHEHVRRHRSHQD
ncbi:NOL1/NOP2/sun family protein [Colletotrichum karsti]|uniref:NOL1/NOP2/sun family protein n=1 Tax=Colletotrichum karsti TaxID=1095194 RepID=A0A9P6I646_9PEZI|nr:NOL1/NOP2/sun family protein [Colletotrichum karsti]KAF9872695.1 NOL1/NOP2/sun family protein [Colletotrichum karsti]